MAKHLLQEKRDTVRHWEDELVAARQRNRVAEIGLAETKLNNARADLDGFEARLRALQEKLACLGDL